MRKLWKILLGVFGLLLIAGIVLIVINSNQNKSKPGPGRGSSPGPSPSIPSGTCNSIINNCKPGFVCTNKPPYKCVPTPCSPACKTGEFCYNGFCRPCSCVGLECDKSFKLPCGGNVGETCGKTPGDGCLKKLDTIVKNRNLISTFYPFLYKDVDWKTCVENIRTSINQDLELQSVFSIKDYDGNADANRLIININNNSQEGFPEPKIEAGFFKICNIALEKSKVQNIPTLGVFVYQYEPFSTGGSKGYVCMCSYAFTLPDQTTKNTPTYIQGTAPVPPGPAGASPYPAITGIFNQTNPLPDKNNALTFNKKTSIYYSSGLYSETGGPENTCKVNTTDSNDELGTYLIGDTICDTKNESQTCGGNSDGNYFNQLIGKCICNNCVDSSSMCTTSNAPKYDASLGPNIKNGGWWPVGKHCPPTCVWESCYDKEPGPSCSLGPGSDSDTSDNWSKWDVRPSGCKPMHLACLGRGTQKRYRHLKNVVWDYPSPSNLTCNILGSDTTISGTQGEPGPSLPPILPADTLDKDLSNYIPYLGYWKEDGTYVPNPDIYDTDTRPCGVSISVCGTGHQGGENLSSPGASCKKAGLYWNVAPFIPLGPGPSGIIVQPGPFCSMCHSGATSTGSDYDKNLENRKNVPEYNKSGASSNLSSVKSGSCWCDATWCHTNLDQGPGTDDVNPNGCFTASDPSGNMGKLGSSQSACWAYWACPGAGCEHLQQCASTTCDQGTCRVNEVGSGEVTWFKCGPNQLNVYCTADSDCPGSYCANKPPKKPPYQCFSGSKTYPNCVIVPNPNKSSPGAYKGDGVGGYYTIYGGPSSPGYDYGVYNSPTDDNQGTKNCNEYGIGAPWRKTTSIR